jgi:hypothetical protein
MVWIIKLPLDGENLKLRTRYLLSLNLIPPLLHCFTYLSYATERELRRKMNGFILYKD